MKLFYFEPLPNDRKEHKSAYSVIAEDEIHARELVNKYLLDQVFKDAKIKGAEIIVDDTAAYNEFKRFADRYDDWFYPPKTLNPGEVLKSEIS